MTASVRTPEHQAYWDRWHCKTRRDTHTSHQEFRSRFLSLVPESSTPRILELGCGQGYDAAAICERGFTVEGLDISPTAIAHARRQPIVSGSATVTATFTVADIAAPLPFDDGAFAATYAYLSLHYFNEETTRRVFDEIRRVLRPGGLLGFVVKSVNDRLYGQGLRLGADFYSLDGHARHFFSAEFTRRLIREWGDADVSEYEGRYVGGTAVDTFIAVLARRPES